MFCERMAEAAFALALRRMGINRVKGGLWVGVRQAPDRTPNTWSPQRAQEMKVILLAIARERPSICLVEQFLAERCETAPDARERSGSLYRAYSKWMDAAGEPKITPVAFGCAMRELGFRGRKSNVRVWLGVKIRSQQR